MYYILLFLFLPFRLIRFIYFLTFGLFHRGNHLLIEIPSKFASYRKTSIVEWVTGKDSEVLFLDFLNDLDLIAKSKRVKKVSFFINADLEFGMAEMSNIASMIEKIKTKGIETSGFASSGDIKSLYLLSFVQKRFSTPYSEFTVLLPAVESFFFGNLFKKLGVKVDSFASGPYKSFAESFNRNSFSIPAKDNLTMLIRSIKTQLLDAFYDNTKLESKILKRPILTSTYLKEIGFLNGFLEEENFRENFCNKDYEELDATGSNEIDTETSMSDVKFFNQKKNFRIFPKKKKKIVILPLKGNIGMGKKEEYEIKSDAIHAYPVLAALKNLREDKSIKGVILEIDSPGGSAFASELIYQEILKLRKNVKVYAYFQNVAASGGYYIASACDKIISNPFCITGSIGTVMIRPNLKKLYNKYGVSKQRIEFYPLREIFSEYGQLSPESKDFLTKEIKRVNGQFYERVMLSRKKNLNELESLAQGRVFTGKSFLASSMVDSTESFLGTVEELKKDLALEQTEIQYIPSIYSLKSMVREFRFGLSMLFNPKNILTALKADKGIQLKSEVAELIVNSWK
ncbi:MAG: signal peptide peptidase SppA [Leptospiraceae bacterium]|nr:signal peptide peptidase SppA [Leptospiraceae bacterium]